VVASTPIVASALTIPPSSSFALLLRQRASLDRLRRRGGESLGESSPWCWLARRWMDATSGRHSCASSPAPVAPDEPQARGCACLEAGIAAVSRFD
jgi:hypothetical protein